MRLMMNKNTLTLPEAKMRIAELEVLVMNHALALSRANKANEALTVELIKLKTERLPKGSGG